MSKFKSKALIKNETLGWLCDNIYCFFLSFSLTLVLFCTIFLLIWCICLEAFSLLSLVSLGGANEVPWKTIGKMALNFNPPTFQSIQTTRRPCSPLRSHRVLMASTLRPPSVWVSFHFLFLFVKLLDVVLIVIIFLFLNRIGGSWC